MSEHAVRRITIHQLNSRSSACERVDEPWYPGPFRCAGGGAATAEDADEIPVGTAQLLSDQFRFPPEASGTARGQRNRPGGHRQRSRLVIQRIPQAACAVARKGLNPAPVHVVTGALQAGAVCSDRETHGQRRCGDGLPAHDAGDLPRAFRTAYLWLIHAADCRSRYSSWTCRGVRY